MPPAPPHGVLAAGGSRPVAPQPASGSLPLPRDPRFHEQPEPRGILLCGRSTLTRVSEWMVPAQREAHSNAPSLSSAACCADSNEASACEARASALRSSRAARFWFRTASTASARASSALAWASVTLRSMLLSWASTASHQTEVVSQRVVRIASPDTYVWPACPGALESQLAIAPRFLGRGSRHVAGALHAACPRRSTRRTSAVRRRRGNEPPMLSRPCSYLAFQCQHLVLTFFE